MRSAGIGHRLADMGEPRALDARLDGGPWRIGVARPDALSQIADTLEIIDKAGSTSAAYEFRFDPAVRFNHLFDPVAGSPSNAPGERHGGDADRDGRGFPLDGLQPHVPRRSPGCRLKTRCPVAPNQFEFLILRDLGSTDAPLASGTTGF
jgi:ApbE family